MDNTYHDRLYLHEVGAKASSATARVLVVGEVLWDQFPDTSRLGGAPLNFAVFCKRLRHTPWLVSGVGTDPLGAQTRDAIAALGLETSLIQSTNRFQTGTAIVRIGPGDETSFTIQRPAAYDAVTLPDATVLEIARWDPEWFYYGTLFPSSVEARRVLEQLLSAVPNADRFYDLNLRPGFKSPELVQQLLLAADVVKLNERELQFVHEHLQLPPDAEGFCRVGSERYGWRAACVTLGARGCAMFLGEQYVEVPAVPVQVADPVGAGDAFAAGFLHGIVSKWPPLRVALFANEVASRVVRVRGALPEATPEGQSRP